MKIKTLIFLLLLSGNLVVWADDLSGHGETQTSRFGDLKIVDGKAFLGRFHVRGEIFIMDPSGRRLVSQLAEERHWSAGNKSQTIESNWAFEANGIRSTYIHHIWKIRDNNSVDVTIQQYEGLSKYKEAMQKGPLVREQNFTLENFAPISWVAETGKEYQVVVRFTPELEPSKSFGSLDKIPIGGDRNSFQVTDNQGYLWAENVRFGGLISGLQTHRGALLMSFYPFKGAIEMGTASGKKITLNVTDQMIVKILNNETDIVPGDLKVRVYGIYLPNFKSGSPRSVWSLGVTKLDDVAKEFLDAINKK